MPIATPDTYKAMLKAARAGGHALPAINVTSSSTMNAAMAGFAEAESDGILQISTGGGEFASGLGVKNMVAGAEALALFGHSIASQYPVNFALHTDHCPKAKLDGYVRPLIAKSAARRAEGEMPLFQSHMFDGAELPLDQNLKISRELLDEMAALDIILEIEIGIVGGEEDGIDNEDVDRKKLYTSPSDMLAVAEHLGIGEHGTYLLAAVFGNVHGVYKPGNVKLDPKILAAGQEAVEAAHGAEGRFYLVFHGGSGSTISDIHETLGYGVIKMNVDTDAQYAYTRPVAAHMFANYDGVLKVDGEVGNKKTYDPRSYLKLAERSMADRVIEACTDLKSAGTTLGT
jgi:fructose-bisphosphate aldolase class II